MMSLFRFVVLLSFAFMVVPQAQAWSKEGHVLTCQIAQGLLNAEATEAVQKLLPRSAEGNLPEFCVWADQVRFRFRWSSPLHYANTPDVCNFRYSRDCHDQNDVEDRCVAGAIRNYTSQLTAEYRERTSDRQHNLTEALLFLSHFVGDIHQPLHVGFLSDEGGNTINVRWFRRKSNLHHVWDRDIILEALSDFYDKDMGLLLQDINHNITDDGGVWTNEVPTWERCTNINTCINRWAEESISDACKWSYEGVEEGVTLGEEYFDSRLPVLMKRLAQGGVRLAMLLNRIFSEDAAQGFASSI